MTTARAATRATKSKKRSPKKVPPNDRIRGEWLRRVEAEYRSAAITQHLTLWLIQIGASPDLIRAGLRIAGDELTHADLSHRAYVAAGGTDMPHIPRESLGLTRREHELLEHDVTRVCVDVFCLGETVAVPLFKELRAGCTVPVARRVLDRVLRDEVRHRDFGWALFGWLLELPLANALRAQVQRELPSYFSRIRAVYAPESVKGHFAIADEDRAWGLMAAGRYAEIVHRTLDRDWVPRFRKLGFDAREAWGS